MDPGAVAALDDGGPRDRLPALQDPAQHPVERARSQGAPPDSLRASEGRDGAHALRLAQRAFKKLRGRLRGRHQQPAAALSRDRVRVGQAGDRAPDDAEGVSHLQGRAPQARVPRRDDRRHEHRRVLQAQHRRSLAASRLSAAERARADDRGAGHQGDQGATRVPARRRARLHHHRPRCRDTLRRRGAANPACDSDRKQADGRAVHPR
jgi:hypothetical protein